MGSANNSFVFHPEGEVMAIIAIGIDLAKNVFAVHGVDAAAKGVLVRREAGQCLEDLPGWANTAIGDLLSELHRLDERIAEYDRHIETMAKADDRCRKLMAIPGIGDNTATALTANIGSAHDFKCGKQLAAWLGLVPSQYSSGGKQRLGRITKAGGSYLRMLLILGARAVVAKNARMAWAMLSKGEAFRPMT